jgi:NAD(P)-dependent dehydrogenase (short-subunit alcohol dehydrogenase family)
MTVVITGANRGIGLALARAYLQRGDDVVATARKVKESTVLNNLAQTGKLRVLQLDVADAGSVEAFAKELGNVTVDILVNNAGISGGWDKLDDLDIDNVLQVFNTNAAGTLRVTKALLGRVPKRTGKLIHITSQMGSIDDNTSGGSYAYRMSKAALNMASKSLAVDLAGKGIISVVVHPGWVQTDMGGKSAPMTPEICADNIVKLADRLTMEDTGKFFHSKGTELPW